MLACVWLSLICFAVEFGGLMGGVSMFHVALNGFDIFAHFLGGILTCWYIVEAWHFVSLWYLWVFFWSERQHTRTASAYLSSVQLPFSPSATLAARCVGIDDRTFERDSSLCSLDEIDTLRRVDP